MDKTAFDTFVKGVMQSVTDGYYEPRTMIIKQHGPDMAIYNAPRSFKDYFNYVDRFWDNEYKRWLVKSDVMNIKAVRRYFPTAIWDVSSETFENMIYQQKPFLLCLLYLGSVKKRGGAREPLATGMVLDDLDPILKGKPVNP